ncbi:MAG: AAA family ATPase [Bacteroidaceae bacterium]|nr:AAA family ATPase [Bacteroidaceae bacterium]
MKFIKLEIKNIASIGEATIDFSTAPLAGEPLFLISGDTGSGKSTILDAICLALYNTAPRLEGYGNEDYEDTELNLDSGEKVKIANPLQLVRRNAKEAFARLTFIGNNEKHYLATWHARRGVRNDKLKATSILYCQETEITIDARIAFDAQIANPEVVGLKFDEFCRTTMLAQGAFTRFLNSKACEKSDILEKLTGTEIYSKISIYIHNTYRNKKEIHETKKLNIKANEPLKAEVRENICTQLKEEEKRVEKFKNDIVEAEKKLTWLNDYANNSAEVKKAEERLAAIVEKWEADERNEEKELLKDWKATDEVRRNHSILEKAVADSEKQNIRREELQKEHTILLYNSRAIGETIQEKKEEQQQLQLRLDNAQKDIPMYENAGALVVRMKALIKKNAEEKRIRNDIDEKEITLKKLSDEFEALFAERQAREAEFKKKGEEHEKAVEELQKQPSLLETAQRKERVEKLANTLKEIEQCEDRTRVQQERIKNTESELTKAYSEEKKIDEERKEAAAECKRQEELYAAMHLRIDDHAKALRARLKIGDECPVCGEIVRSILHDNEIKELLSPIEEAKEKALKRQEKAETAYKNITISISSRKTICEEAAKLIESENETHKRLVRLFEELCTKCGIASQERKNVYSAIEEERSIIADLQKRLITLSNNVSTLSKEKDILVGSLNSFMKIYGRKEADINQTKNFIESDKMQLNQCLEEIALTRDELASSITLEDWEENIEKSIETLEQRAASYNSVKEKNEQTKQFITKFKDLEQRIENMRKDASSLLSSSEGTENVTKVIPIEKLEEEWTLIAKACILLKQEIERTSEEKKQYESLIDTFYGENTSITRERVALLRKYDSGTIAEIEKRISTLKQELENAKSLAIEWKNKFDALMLRSPELKEEESIEYLTEQKKSIENMRSEAEKNIGGYTAILEDDDNKIKMMEKEREEEKMLEREVDKWKRLNDIFGSSDGKKFKQITQSYILMQLLENANYYLRQFTTRYELATQPGSLVILITDRESNDVSRPSNTLSGGESFMVSLALALGLSSLNRNNFTPDTLFIDEGFGTLSSDCLNTVIETLEVLHSIGNRRVGIISHVNELYERIATRIDVKKRAGISEIKIAR